MKKYYVEFSPTVDSVEMNIEANNEEEAFYKAWEIFFSDVKKYITGYLDHYITEMKGD